MFCIILCINRRNRDLLIQRGGGITFFQPDRVDRTAEFSYILVAVVASIDLARGGLPLRDQFSLFVSLVGLVHS